MDNEIIGDSYPLSIALIISYHKCIPLYSSEENKYLFKQLVERNEPS